MYFIKHHCPVLDGAAASVSKRQMLITISKVGKAIMDPCGLLSTDFAKLNNSRAFLQLSL